MRIRCKAVNASDWVFEPTARKERTAERDWVDKLLLKELSRRSPQPNYQCQCNNPNVAESLLVSRTITPSTASTVCERRPDKCLLQSIVKASAGIACYTTSILAVPHIVRYHKAQVFFITKVLSKCISCTSMLNRVSYCHWQCPAPNASISCVVVAATTQ